MSIDLNWETLTTGPDGIALAESIRDFIHDRFQTVTLPRFIKTVSVHAFAFGAMAPEIEIKDICDPLPDFYEENEENQSDEEVESEESLNWQPATATPAGHTNTPKDKQKLDRGSRSDGPLQVDTRLPLLRSMQAQGELGSPFFGAGTPGISGGTSNMSYFHSHLATGLSGTQTPLAAVAGGHLPRGWPDYSALSGNSRRGHRHSASGSSISPTSTGDSTQHHTLREKDSVSTLAALSSIQRPRTQDGLLDEDVPEEPTSPPRRYLEPRVEDLQTVFRVRYSGDVKLSLTAEILLDYPMPSFVGIPLKLNITGLSFDGVAVVAYIRKRAHFCFLSQEDAIAAIGPEDEQGNRGFKMGGLLQEIKVESEIGLRENGKQSLKNVGKVEKFVLEQVRRIFEDEFVYPSFWTFLV